MSRWLNLPVYCRASVLVNPLDVVKVWPPFPFIKKDLFLCYLMHNARRPCHITVHSSFELKLLIVCLVNKTWPSHRSYRSFIFWYKAFVHAASTFACWFNGVVFFLQYATLCHSRLAGILQCSLACRQGCRLRPLLSQKLACQERLW